MKLEFYLCMTSYLPVGVLLERVAADGQDVQVVAEITHPLENKIKNFSTAFAILKNNSQKGCLSKMYDYHIRTTPLWQRAPDFTEERKNVATDI